MGWSKSPRHPLVSLIALLLLGAGSQRARAQGVIITGRPDSAFFEPGDSGSIFLELTSDRTVDRLRLTWLYAEGFRLRTVTPLPRRLADSIPVVIELRVIALAEALPRPIELRLDYRHNGRPGMTFRTFRMVADPYGSPAQAVAVQVVAGLGLLTRDRPDSVHLLVTNRMSAPVHILTLTATSRYLAVDTTHNQTIEPLAIGHISLAARVTEQVRPGKYPMILDLHMRWTGLTGPRSGHLLLNQEVEVGVTGVSDILTALAVPSFYLLPGVLMVATFSLLWSLGALRFGATTEFPLKKGEPEFWLVAITLSILAALAYRLIFKVNYLDSYGAADVARLWFGSILLSAAVYLVAHLGWHLYLRRTYPVPGSSEIEVIRRLPRMGLLLGLKGVRSTDNNDDFWLLSSKLKDRGLAFVVPTIDLDESELEPKAQADLDKLLSAAVTSADALEDLVRILEKMEGKLKWSQMGQWPLPVDVAKLRVTTSGRLVEPK